MNGYAAILLYYCQHIMNRNILVLLLGMTTFSSCDGFFRKPPAEPRKVWGYRPVFSTDSSLAAIKSDTARKIKVPGKIYVKDGLIFQNDIGLGVHILDASDPAHLLPLGYIHIPGNNEISIKGNFLYANSYQDLVVVDVSNWSNVQLVRRIPNAYNNGTSYYRFTPVVPVPEHGVYYQCYGFELNPSKVHTGWVGDSIYPQCYNP
jgi:hypothetical protein